MDSTNRTIISANPARNMCMAIYTNIGPTGKKSSITRHEALVENKFTKPKQHGYTKKEDLARSPIATVK